MKSVSLFLLLCCVGLIGCGGGEDFSAPPPGLAAQRENSKATPKPDPPVQAKKGQAPAAAGEETAASQQGTTPPTTLQMIAAQGGEASSGATGDAGDDQAAATQSPEATDPEGPPTGDMQNALAGNPAAGDPSPVVDAGAGPDATGQAPALSTDATAEPDGPQGEADTAMAAATDKPEADTEKKGGISFLDALKTEPKKGAAAGRPGSDRRSVERTGRLAVSLRVWLQLKFALSKQFFLAATDDATRLAASSGERKVTLVSTRVEQRLLENGQQLVSRASRLAQQRTASRNDTQEIAALPAVINSMELIQRGNLVLIGTVDGRLIARSAADLLNWDVYARDLFAFQDEHRPATRISDTGVVVVRRISEERLLTIDANNVCRLWTMSDVVHQPIPPLEMTVEQVRSPDVDVLPATPKATVTLSSAQVLTVSLSASRALGAIVTADEIATIFRTDTGEVVASLGAEDFDDTQPVVVDFLEGRQHLLVGLADGRIFRRALPGGAAVKSRNDDGIEVDYEAIFAPARTDRSGAVTAIAVDPDGSVMHFGRLDGNMHKFDLPRKELVSTRKMHSGTVTDIRITNHGVLSLGDDRTAHLTEMPLPAMATAQPAGAAVAARRSSPRTSEKFSLPRDPSLPQQPVQKKDGDKEKSSRPRNPAARAAVVEQSPAELGIRPADPQLALLQHQLRVSLGDAAAPIREQILTAQERTAGSAGTDDAPARLGEVVTNIDYGTRIVDPVIMSVSNDGLQVSYVGRGREISRGRAQGSSVNVVDVPTQTVLRTWYGVHSVLTGLDASWEDGIVLPEPLEARLNARSGQLKIENPFVQLGRFAWSYDRRNILTERLGLTGQAMDTFSIQTPDGEVLRNGVESFEGAVGAMAYSADGSTAFVSIREKSRIRLLELDAQTLDVVAELANEPMTGPWNVEQLNKSIAMGPIHLLPSPGGRLLITYGKHEKKYHLRIWRKSGTKWPQDQVTVMDSSSEMLASNVEHPMVFVNQKDNLLAVVGAEGIGTLDTRTGDVKDRLPIPDVLGRRPMITFTRDGKYALSGDGEGNVWIAELRSLDRRPKKFTAQAGEITGLALSADGTKLATAGRENRIRVWDLETFLYGDTRTAGK